MIKTSLKSNVCTAQDPSPSYNWSKRVFQRKKISSPTELHFIMKGDLLSWLSKKELEIKNSLNNTYIPTLFYSSQYTHNFDISWNTAVEST